MSDVTSPVTVYLALGANLGDRRANIEAALTMLEADCGPFLRSSIYETLPWGDPDQPPFLNLVVRGQTRLTPHRLLCRVKAAERRVGRMASRRWGPREIDVDVLAYGRAVIRTRELEVPHPRLHERGFVLVPLAELAPDWVHPVLGKTPLELLAGLPPQETTGVRRWSDTY